MGFISTAPPDSAATVLRPSVAIPCLASRLEASGAIARPVAQASFNLALNNCLVNAARWTFVCSSVLPYTALVVNKASVRVMNTLRFMALSTYKRK